MYGVKSTLFSYIFPDTPKYSIDFECLAGLENGPIHALIKRTSLVIPTASDLADSLNTNVSFVNNVSVCAEDGLHLSKRDRQG